MILNEKVKACVFLVVEYIVRVKSKKECFLVYQIAKTGSAFTTLQIFIASYKINGHCICRNIEGCDRTVG